MKKNTAVSEGLPEQEETATLPMKLDVTVRLVEPKGNLVGFANLRINDSFLIDDFKILQSEKGLYVGMPSKPDKNSKTGYRETARPITKAFRAELFEAVATAYHAEVEKLQARAAAILPTEKSFKEQLADGAKLAAKENTERPAPAKGKVQHAER